MFEINTCTLFCVNVFYQKPQRWPSPSILGASCCISGRHHFWFSFISFICLPVDNEVWRLFFLFCSSNSYTVSRRLSWINALKIPNEMHINYNAGWDESAVFGARSSRQRMLSSPYWAKRPQYVLITITPPGGGCLLPSLPHVD